MSDAYRIVVRVDDDNDNGTAGWLVRVTDPAAGDLVPPYDMPAVQVKGRRVPITPADRTPQGAGALTGLCGGDLAQIGQLLERLRIRDARADDVGNYGAWLFACLLAPAWDAIRAHPGVAAARGVELALRWRSDEPDLPRMVWEAMRDDRAPLAGHPDLLVAVTRLVPADPVELRTIHGLPRVLFASGARLSDPTIRPGAMYMGLLRDLDARGRCQAWAVQATTLDILRDRCAQLHPDVVHVVAHGAVVEGRAVLLMGPGDEEEADAGALLAALTAGGKPLAAVVSACNTAASGAGVLDPGETAPLSARLVAGGIPVVVAMSGEVSEPACRQFTRRLADGVHSGKSIVVASAHGRRAALVGAVPTELDWALPAVFLNEHVAADAALVDPARSQELYTMARDMGLAREPMFLGRADILAAAERLVDPAAAEGVLAVLATSSMSRLGSKRVLQEVGWRLLRAGHVPLLLDPGMNAKAPVMPPALVCLILKQLVQVAQNLRLAPIVPRTLQEGGPAAAAPVDEAQDGDGVRRSIRQRINAFALAGAAAPGLALDPDTVRDLLAADIAALAAAAAQLPAPFGEGTTGVLLCPNVHEWADTSPDGGALAFLLKMLLPASGLGSQGRHVPVMFTGSRTQGGGAALHEWSERAGTRVPDLGPLDRPEVVLGYQWILLHPWGPPGQPRSRIYTSRRDWGEAWEQSLAKVDPSPEAVTDRLYEWAEYMNGIAVQEGDDEQAWRTYVVHHPEYQL